MAGDLGVATQDVHAKAREVLGFWFELLMPEQRFAKLDSVDAEIDTLFGALRDEVLRTEAGAWRDDPETLLAAIILLDQFSRNLHRGEAEAFAADALAQQLTRQAIARGWDQDMTTDQRQFLYMPLMHAEDDDLQQLSLSCFEALEDDNSLAFAREHAEVIARFGRFPTRNEALGRESTPEEAAYLRQPDVGW